MADPTKYQRGYSFSGYQTTNPKQPLPAPRVDDELENIELAIGELADAMKSIRRADGKLQNGSVTLESLGVDLVASVLAVVDSALADAVIQGATLYATRAEAADKLIPVSAAYIRTAGYATAGAGGGALYKRLGSAPSPAKAWHFQSADGAWWQIAERVLTPEMFGGKGDNVADDTAALQALVDAAAVLKVEARLTIPPVAWRTTAPINIKTSIHLRGAGMPPAYAGDPAPGGVPTGIINYPYGVRGPGCWVHLDHLDKGFVVSTGTPYPDGLQNVVIEGFGTYRNQPLPVDGQAFTPLACDYDFWFEEADAFIRDMMLYNPTFGIRLERSRSGRFTIQNVRGQPLRKGIVLMEAYDVCRITDIHFWIYWAAHESVREYTQYNCTGLELYKIDGPEITNYFCIFHLYGWYIGHNAAAASPGTSIRLQANNVYWDGVTNGMIISPQAVNAILVLHNVIAAGNPGLTGEGIMIKDQGTNSDIVITNFEGVRANWNIVNMAGTNGRLAITNAKFARWNQTSGNPAVGAILCGAGNRVDLHGDIEFDATGVGSGSTVLAYGGGRVRGGLAMGYASATTDANGRIQITHGAKTYGCVPTYGAATFVSGGVAVCQPYAISSTVLSVGCYATANGAPVANTAVTLEYRVFLSVG